MLKRAIIGFIGSGILALVACQPAAPQSAQPILPAIDQTPEVTDSLATETPFRRPTLPPTWTPTDEPTATRTPDPSETPDDTSQPSEAGGACEGFGPDVARNSGMVVEGREATVYWLPASDVFYYEIVLRDANGNQLDLRRTQPSVRSYTFDDGLFAFNEIYTWQVTPYDASGNPICQTASSELRGSLR